MILKPSPQTPTVVEQMAKAFDEAGLPAGVLQYFHSGSPTVIETVVRNPLVAAVCFTGSVAGGLAVQRSAADRLVSVGLELGGKDPAYVRPDTDIAWAAEQLVDGCVFNSGQSCCAIERVYVHADVHDEFVKAAQEVLRGYRLGDPADKATHVGPVVSKRAKDMIEGHVCDALDRGAQDATPDNATFASPPVGGNYVKPTLLTGVTHDMAIMTEETFGPVIPVMKVRDDKEAVALMNDSEFGLTASVWTKNKTVALQLVDQVEAGTVFVNRCDYPSPVSCFSTPLRHQRTAQSPQAQAHKPRTHKPSELTSPQAHKPTSPQIPLFWQLADNPGSGMDGMEELGQGPHAQPLWLRPVPQAEELPPRRRPGIKRNKDEGRGGMQVDQAHLLFIPANWRCCGLGRVLLVRSKGYIVGMSGEGLQAPGGWNAGPRQRVCKCPPFGANGGVFCLEAELATTCQMSDARSHNARSHDVRYQIPDARCHQYLFRSSCQAHCRDTYQVHCKTQECNMGWRKGWPAEEWGQ